MDNEDTIEAGSVVHLKSGGPPMVVQFVANVRYDYNLAHVSWFDAAGQVNHDSFAVPMLEPTSEASVARWEVIVAGCGKAD
jgi:uncharacterized protein YodC (DUF2158 family)